MQGFPKWTATSRSLPSLVKQLLASLRFPLCKFVFSWHWIISVPFDIYSTLSWEVWTNAMLFHCEITLEIVEGWSMTIKYCPSIPAAKATSVMRSWDSDPLDSKAVSLGFLSERMWNMLTFWACQLLCLKHASTMKDLAISANLVSDRYLL